MKAVLKFSIGLNLALMSGLVWTLVFRQPPAPRPAPTPIQTKPPVQAVTPPVPPVAPAPFRWNQLVSTNSYRAFVANLRAIGCPEPTIEDIVQGDVDRAFAYERSQLKLGGSGDGPWSQAAANQLLGRLLAPPTGGEPDESSSDAENGAERNERGEVADTASPAPNTEAVPAAYPLFLQNVNWSALGFTANERGVIAQVRQQFQNEVNGLNQDPNLAANQNSSNSNSTQRRQQALQNADNQLRDLLGAQAYAAYELQAYYNWYQPQVTAAAASQTRVINPEAFGLK